MTVTYTTLLILVHFVSHLEKNKNKLSAIVLMTEKIQVDVTKIFA